MKHSVVSSSYCHSSGELLKSHALLTALPKGFLLKSSSSKSMAVNPGISVEDLKVLIKGWPTILTADSTIYYRLRRAVMSASFHQGRVDLQVYSSDKNADELAQKAIDPFSKYKFENKDEGGVWVNFAFASSMGVQRNTQFIRCPEWADIEDNYSHGCRQEIGRTIARKRPWADGRLMIWHGEPGTGKTFAIRSLLMGWRENFNFVIVTDPEKLLESPAYYYEVASAPNMNSIPGEDSPDDDDEGSTSKKKRLLFIIEDSANLISTESRKDDGNKFGKLLNITDGLIGQGREDVFLITFNEALEDIDPAIVRPGRCLSNVEFGKLGDDEVRRWIRKNNLILPEEPITSASLAELYQMKANTKKQSPVTV
jgi:hypothetical protein